MMKKLNVAGFSLIEVIIAFIIIAVGSGAMVQLHRGYLRQEASNTLREQAMHLAENKLDDLRTFDVIRTTSGKIAYQDINTNAGGTISAGVKTLAGGSFTLGWNVTNNYLTSPAAAIPERKDINISVSWVDSENNSRSLLLSSAISQQLNINSSQLNGSMGVDTTQPLINYTPGTAPDVVAVTIKTGTKAETSKPLPTVYQTGNSTLVQFETITYDLNTQKEIQEDQLTLSCTCNLQSSSASELLPATPLQVEQGLFWTTGANSTKTFGQTTGNQNTQSPYCSICCNNHFDGSASTFDQFYNQSRKNHGHYSYSSGYTTATTGNNYLEACRLLRIDGLYKPMPDWNLVALNVMSPDFLTNTLNQQNYENYVKAVVNSHYTWQKGSKSIAFSFPSLNTWLGTNVTNGGATTTNTTLAAGGNYQLIARGIYVDMMNDETGKYLSTLTDNDPELLAKVPFNEINLTLLANWSIATADQSYATVTNQPLQTIVDPDQNYYGTYSRGRLAALQSSMTGNSGNPKTITVTTTIRNSNSGITSTTPISTADVDASSTATLGLLISGASTGTPLHVTGNIKCLTDPKNNQTVPQVCKSNEWSGLTVSSSNAGVTCTMNAPTGSNIAGFFDCSVTRGSSVIINFAASGYRLTPSSLSLSSTQTNQPNNIATISLDGSNPCTVMMVKNTVPNYTSYSCTP